MSLELDFSNSANRKSVSKLRYWCEIGGTHQDEPDCNWEGCLPGKNSHRLRKRRMIVCDCCEQGYFNQKDFNDHVCGSAYC